MSLQDEIYKRIKLEIQNDPQGLGYAGKTDDEIQVILNSAVVTERIVYDTSPSPMNRIMSGLAGTENVVSKAEVSDAKLVAVDAVPDIIP